MTEKSTTILLVDDDPDFLESTQALLESAGYHIITADSEKAAEERFHNEKVDAALLDLMLENADGGFSLCHRLKKEDPSLPIILVTAVASETGIDFDAETEEEKSWIKADTVLAKPVRLEELERELQKLCSDSS